MKSPHLPSKYRFIRRFHALWCNECRTASPAHEQIQREIDLLKKTATPEDGLQQVLNSVLQAEALGQGSMPFSMGLGRRRNRWFSQRNFLRAIPVAGVLLCIPLGWWHYANLDPQIVVPSPTLPNPNGYDLLVEAGNTLSPPTKDSSGNPTDTPEAKKLSQAISDATMKPELAQKMKTNVYSLAEKKALLAKCEPAFQRAHDALKLPYMAPPSRSFYTLFPEYAKFRNLARAYNIKVRVQIDTGDYNGAMDTICECIEMGNRIPRGGLIIAKLVGIAVEAIGRSNINEVIQKLDAPSAAKATKRLEQVLETRVPTYETMTEEKYFTQAALMEILSKSSWRTDWIKLYGAYSSDAQTQEHGFGEMVKALPLFFISKRTILHNYTNYIDKVIAYHIAAENRPFGQPEIEEAELTKNLDMITSILAPVFSQAYFKDLENRNLDSLFMMELALQAYKQKQGHYPESLSALVPMYVPQVPRDPFLPSQDLKYMRKGDTYVLYSVGPDLKDDHGTPALNPEAKDKKDVTPKYLHMVQPQSKGDIVAGINN